MPSNDFMRKMQEESDAILKRMYKDYSKFVYAPNPLLDSLPRPGPRKPSLWRRIVYRHWQFREWLACILAGRDINEQ